jgi:hypothetical protein
MQKRAIARFNPGMIRFKRRHVSTDDKSGISLLLVHFSRCLDTIEDLLFWVGHAVLLKSVLTVYGFGENAQ